MSEQSECRHWRTLRWHLIFARRLDCSCTFMSRDQLPRWRKGFSIPANLPCCWALLPQKLQTIRLSHLQVCDGFFQTVFLLNWNPNFGTILLVQDLCRKQAAQLKEKKAAAAAAAATGSGTPGPFPALRRHSYDVPPPSNRRPPPPLQLQQLDPYLANLGKREELANLGL